MGGTNSEICVGRESVKRGLVQVRLVWLVWLVWQGASVASERGGTEGFVASSQKLRFVNSLLVKRETNIFSNRFYKKCYSQTKY